jgi:hypothetical protein
MQVESQRNKPEYLASVRRMIRACAEAGLGWSEMLRILARMRIEHEPREAASTRRVPRTISRCW